MLNALKLRMFTKAVEIKVNRGEDLEDVLAQYTALNDAEKQQLREAVTGVTENN